MRHWSHLTTVATRQNSVFEPHHHLSCHGRMRRISARPLSMNSQQTPLHGALCSPRYRPSCSQRRSLQRRSLQRRSLQRRGLQRRNLQRRGIQRGNLQRGNLQRRGLHCSALVCRALQRSANRRAPVCRTRRGSLGEGGCGGQIILQGRFGGWLVRLWRTRSRKNSSRLRRQRSRGCRWGRRPRPWRGRQGPGGEVEAVVAPAP